MGAVESTHLLLSFRQLEDALQIAHSSTCKTPHPLLSGDLLAVKSGVDDLMKESNEGNVVGVDADNDEELASAMGTLTVSECGATRFIGRLAAEVSRDPSSRTFRPSR